MPRMMTGEQMVEIIKNSNNGKESGNKMTEFVRVYNLDDRGFIENMMKESKETRNRFTMIAFMWIKKLNFYQRIKLFDARTDYNIGIAKTFNDFFYSTLNELVNCYKGTIGNSEFITECDSYGEVIPFEKIFVEQVSISNQTQHQLFTMLVFNWIALLEIFDSSKVLTELSPVMNSLLDNKFITHIACLDTRTWINKRSKDFYSKSNKKRIIYS